MYKSTLPRGFSRKTRPAVAMLRKNVSVCMLVVVLNVSVFQRFHRSDLSDLSDLSDGTCFLSGNLRGRQPISSFQIIFTVPARRFLSSAGNWSSVTSVSISSRWAKVNGSIAPTLLESTTITTRRARRITARLRSASS